MLNRDLYINKIKEYIDTPVIKVITGIRRCGKSYLLKLIEKELVTRGVNENNIITINFESLVFEEYKEYRTLYNYIQKMSSGVSGKVYLLIDEVQEVEDWELAIRSLLVDIDCDIYLTGSNAHMLSGELSTGLAGRYVELNMYPLSFKEYLFFNSVSEKNISEVEKHFFKYIKFGGFPGLSMMPDNDDVIKNYLVGIHDSVVLKDVIKRNNIRDAEMLERVLIYIMDNIGQVFSGENIIKYLKSKGYKLGVETVYKYIRALESAMIIYPAKRYDIKGKKLLQRMEKYFITDLGLRYTSINYKDNDISQYLENIVFFELLRKGYSVNVGKQGEYKVDFIAEKNNTRVYYQVCYLLADSSVIEREKRSLLKINDNYKKIILSMDKFQMSFENGIEWMNIIDFLLS